MYVFCSGFPGMKMVYSDTTENISVTVTAQSGSVFFDPVRIKLQQPLVYFQSAAEVEVAKT